MYKIGIIGPNTTVNRIINLATELEKGMEFVPFPYKEVHETETIVQEHDHQIDIWVFSGQISYQLARRTLKSDENLVYVSPTESGIYKCFLNMAADLNKALERVSIDELSSIYLQEALEQLDRVPEHIFVKTFNVDTQLNELIEFHLNLWNEGKTDGALTSFEATYLALKEAGVPAYWINPSLFEIRQTLRILSEKVKALYFKDTQIGVEIIEIENFDKIVEKAKSPYHLQYLELRLKEALLKLCEKLDGSLLEKGNGHYFIFSTRGAIEREITMLQNIVTQLALESDTSVAVGIGYGKTVFSAEINAWSAIKHSKEKPERGIVVVQENGTVVESVGTGEELAYSFRMDDTALLEKLKKGSISLKTYNRIEALTRRMGKSDFTTKDLATYLYWDERNARRIVSYLCEVDLAECIGEVPNTSRGRPSKNYRLIKTGHN
ncbi:hypothetical protein SD70_22710 [Gordoniibacillus kamchatkensis]|uniref:Transcriptional regulator n=1 Tax=Gordoniibacillus kamchatkensis TaxID=1590651 RepID=A0ABR5ADI4_9BACL|nr:hypothetical protein [Paenibacillus sp. VKM B-2647]KIL39051.1 hypothetical protein SD70_22710 [Paenibacillus sp. VKM B-2647]